MQCSRLATGSVSQIIKEVKELWPKQGTKAGKIDGREDTNPQRALSGSLATWSSPTNKKYPKDTAEHVRAACNYINHKDNAAK